MPLGTVARRRLLRWVAGTGALVSLAACGSQPAAAPTTTPAAPPASSSASASTSGSTSARLSTSSATAAATPAVAASSSPAASTVDLVFTTWGVPPLPEGIATQHAVAAFQAADPTIKVTIEPVPNGPVDAILTKVQAMMAAGTPPDVTLMRPNYIAALVASKSLQSIDPFMAQEKTLGRESYFKGALARLIVAGQLYGLPSDYWFTVLYYNRDSFQSAGVAVPDTTWTWTNFLDAAQKLTTGAGATRRSGTAVPPWQSRVRDNGGHILDAKRTTCLLDQAPAVEGIQWTADLGGKWQAVPTAADLKQQSAQARFLAGNLAMFPQGNFFQGNPVTAKVTFQWDLAPLPVGNIGRRPLSGGANFCMPVGVKSPQTSWRFLKYMGGPEGATFRGKDAGLFPPLPALAKPEVISTFSAAQIKSILDSGQDADPLPVIAKYDQMDKTINAGLAPVWAGTATAKEATATLVPQVNALLQQ